MATRTPLVLASGQAATAAAADTFAVPGALTAPSLTASNGTLNVTTAGFIADVSVSYSATNYYVFQSYNIGSGSQNLVNTYALVVTGGGPIHRAGAHTFQNLAGNTNFASLGSSGLTLSGGISATGGATFTGEVTASNLNGSPVSGAVPGPENPTLGTALGTSALKLTDYTTNYGLAIGVATTSGNTFIQSQRFDGGTNVYSLRLQPMGGSVVVGNSSSALLPGSDNAQNLGSANSRWSTVYAGTGSINTSDGTQKTVRPGVMTPAEIAWARSIKVIAYQFNDAIAEKGPDKARMHFGVVAQDVHAAGVAAGIAEPLHYGFLCQDPLTTTEQQSVTVQRQVTESITQEQDSYAVVNGKAVLTKISVQVGQPVFDTIPVVDANGQPVMVLVSPAVEAVAEVKDADGTVTTPGVPAQAAVYAPATYQVPRMEGVTEQQSVTVPQLDANGAPVMRWGIRYDELAMFLLAAQQTV